MHMHYELFCTFAAKKLKIEAISIYNPAILHTFHHRSTQI